VLEFGGFSGLRKTALLVCGGRGVFLQEGVKGSFLAFLCPRVMFLITLKRYIIIYFNYLKTAAMFFEVALCYCSFHMGRGISKRLLACKKIVAIELKVIKKRQKYLYSKAAKEKKKSFYKRKLNYLYIF